MPSHYLSYPVVVPFGLLRAQVRALTTEHTVHVTVVTTGIGLWRWFPSPTPCMKG